MGEGPVAAARDINLILSHFQNPTHHLLADRVRSHFPRSARRRRGGENGRRRQGCRSATDSLLLLRLIVGVVRGKGQGLRYASGGRKMRRRLCECVCVCDRMCVAAPLAREISDVAGEWLSSALCVCYPSRLGTGRLV